MDDEEGRRLREIEQRLCADDPRLARFFEAASARSAATPRPGAQWPPTRLVGTSLIMLGISTMVAEPAVIVLVLVGALCLLAIRWWRVRSHR